MPYTLTASVDDKEKHEKDVTTLVYRNGKLYSGAEDGKIKVFSEDLKLEKTIDAHPVNVYSIAVDNKLIYSCSNDNTIKWFDISSFSLAKTLQEEDEVIDLYYCDASDTLYSGNKLGQVKIWKNGEATAHYSVMEELHGLCAKGKYLFTAGMMDVVVTETIPEHPNQYTTRQTYDGRGPMILLGNAVCHVQRDGRTITAFDSSSDTHFKVLAKLEGHEMIVNALAGSTAGIFPVLYSGGFDGQVKIWDMKEYKLIDSYNAGKCINALAANGKTIYLGGVNGFIERIDPQ